MAGFAEQAQVSPKYFKPFDERLEAADAAARNAIPRKYARMRVVTLSDQATWRLKACPGGQTLATWGTDDSHWDTADAGASGAGSIDNTALAADIKIGSLAGLRTAWGAAANTFTAVQDFLSNLLGRTAALETSAAANTAGGTATATALAAHTGDHANPHQVTAPQVGLGNVTNDAQVKRAEMGTANGVATLDAGAKIPTAQLPDSVLGGARYKGTYLFAANLISSPDPLYNNKPLPAPTAANAGLYFIVQDAASYQGMIFNAKDYLISNGAAGWDKIDNTDSVTLVNGQQGIVVLSTNEVAEPAAGATNLYFTPARFLGQLLTNYAKNATNRAVAATDSVPVAIGVLEKKVDDTTAKIGSAALTTTAQTLAGAVNELKAATAINRLTYVFPAGLTTRLQIPINFASQVGTYTTETSNATQGAVYTYKNGALGTQPVTVALGDTLSLEATAPAGQAAYVILRST